MRTAVIMGCGTYYSPWTPYTIASTYAITDVMVIVNAGLDVRNPSLDESEIPLDQVTRDISELDVEVKITEVTDLSGLRRKLPLMSQKIANELKPERWYDLRGRNYTMASEIACELGANMVLRVDTDEVCYRDALGIRGRTDGLVLYQYEFQGDLFHLADPGPESPYNDSIEYYKISERDWYFGGRAPVIHSTMKNCPDMHCAHLRFANPIDASEKEKYRHFRDRAFFSLWTNEFGSFSPELEKRAHEVALDLLKKVGKPTDISPPEACLLEREFLREYIEEVA